MAKFLTTRRMCSIQDHTAIAGSEEKRSRFKPAPGSKFSFQRALFTKAHSSIFFTPLTSKVSSSLVSHHDHNHKISGNVEKETDIIPYKWLWETVLILQLYTYWLCWEDKCYPRQKSAYAEIGLSMLCWKDSCIKAGRLYIIS